MGAGGQQIIGLRAVGGKVQVGEQQLPLGQHGTLVRLRLLDLHDHLCRVEDVLRVGDNGGTGGFVIGVGVARAVSRARLYHHLMTVDDSLCRRGGSQADAVFLGLDFCGAADLHGSIS